MKKLGFDLGYKKRLQIKQLKSYFFEGADVSKKHETCMPAKLFNC